MIRIISSGTLAALLALVVMLTQTAPSTVGALGILGVFILLYGVALGGLTLFLFYVARFARSLPVGSWAERRLRGVGLKKSYYYASIIALVPVLAIGLQSVKQVGAYELLLIVLFVALGCFYISRRAS